MGDDFDRTTVLACLEQNAQQDITKKNAPQQNYSVIRQLHKAEKSTKVPSEQRIQRTVDIEAKRAEGKGIGYERWAKVYNLKQMATALFLYETGFHSQDELDAAVNAVQADMQNSRTALKSIEAAISEKRELQKWVISYSKTRDVRDGLKNIKSEKRRAEYRTTHDSDFIIAESAIRYFKAHGITKIPSYRSLQAEIERLIAEKNSVYNAYNEQKSRHKDLTTIQQNLAELHGETRADKTKEHEQTI